MKRNFDYLEEDYIKKLESMSLEKRRVFSRLYYGVGKVASFKKFEFLFGDLSKHKIDTYGNILVSSAVVGSLLLGDSVNIEFLNQNLSESIRSYFPKEISPLEGYKNIFELIYNTEIINDLKNSQFIKDKEEILNHIIDSTKSSIEDSKMFLTGLSVAFTGLYTYNISEKTDRLYVLDELFADMNRTLPKEKRYNDNNDEIFFVKNILNFHSMYDFFDKKCRQYGNTAKNFMINLFDTLIGGNNILSKTLKYVFKKELPIENPEIRFQKIKNFYSNFSFLIGKTADTKKETTEYIKDVFKEAYKTKDINKIKIIAKEAFNILNSNTIEKKQKDLKSLEEYLKIIKSESSYGFLEKILKEKKINKEKKIITKELNNEIKKTNIAIKNIIRLKKIKDYTNIENKENPYTETIAEILFSFENSKKTNMVNDKIKIQPVKNFILNYLNINSKQTIKYPVNRIEENIKKINYLSKNKEKNIKVIDALIEKIYILINEQKNKNKTQIKIINELIQLNNQKIINSFEKKEIPNFKTLIEELKIERNLKDFEDIKHPWSYNLLFNEKLKILKENIEYATNYSDCSSFNLMFEHLMYSAKSLINESYKFHFDKINSMLNEDIIIKNLFNKKYDLNEDSFKYKKIEGVNITTELLKLSIIDELYKNNYLYFKDYNNEKIKIFKKLGCNKVCNIIIDNTLMEEDINNFKTKKNKQLNDIIKILQNIKLIEKIEEYFIENVELENYFNIKKKILINNEQLFLTGIQENIIIKDIIENNINKKDNFLSCLIKNKKANLKVTDIFNLDLIHNIEEKVAKEFVEDLFNNNFLILETMKLYKNNELLNINNIIKELKNKEIEDKNLHLIELNYYLLKYNKSNEKNYIFENTFLKINYEEFKNAKINYEIERISNQNIFSKNEKESDFLSKFFEDSKVYPNFNSHMKWKEYLLIRENAELLKYETIMFLKRIEVFFSEEEVKKTLYLLENKELKRLLNSFKNKDAIEILGIEKNKILSHIEFLINEKLKIESNKIIENNKIIKEEQKNINFMVELKDKIIKNENKNIVCKFIENNKESIKFVEFIIEKNKDITYLPTSYLIFNKIKELIDNLDDKIKQDKKEISMNIKMISNIIYEEYEIKKILESISNNEEIKEKEKENIKNFNIITLNRIIKETNSKQSSYIIYIKKIILERTKSSPIDKFSYILKNEYKNIKDEKEISNFIGKNLNLIHVDNIDLLLNIIKKELSYQNNPEKTKLILENVSNYYEKNYNSVIFSNNLEKEFFKFKNKEDIDNYLLNNLDIKKFENNIENLKNKVSHILRFEKNKELVEYTIHILEQKYNQNFLINNETVKIKPKF